MELRADDQRRSVRESTQEISRKQLKIIINKLNSRDSPARVGEKVWVAHALAGVPKNFRRAQEAEELSSAETLIDEATHATAGGSEQRAGNSSQAKVRCQVNFDKNREHLPT
jgi:hypothetical protein